MSVALRPANTDDEPFLLEVYGSTRLAELALTGWDEAQRAAFVRMQFLAQSQHYQSTFPEARQWVIVSDDLSVGRFYVARRQGEIRILDITTLPAHRNRGIGTSILAGVLDESRRTTDPVHIYVESFNPSLRLFERLGFSQVDVNGVHLLMEWKP